MFKKDDQKLEDITKKNKTYLNIITKIKTFFSLFIYLVIIVYSLEILLFSFTSDLQKSLVDIKGKRIEIAKKKNLKFDSRDSNIVFLEKRNEIKNLSVPFYYSSLFANLNTFKKAKKNNQTIPFRGPLNKKTLSCAEDLTYRIITNDKYGFKNSNSIYKKEIEVILLGGSYAEGFCYTSDKDIAGNLLKEEINTLNLGIATTGPLVALAVLKEFGLKYKPKNVFYLYYENTSLDILEWEAKSKNLNRYLEKNYKTDYLKNIDKVKNFLSSAEKESLKIAYAKVKENKRLVDKRKSYKKNIKDILELSTLKKKVRSFSSDSKKNYDLKFFNKVMTSMQNETKKWNGKFTVVYVPSWDRFFNKGSNSYSLINLRTTIINSLQKNKINLVDLTEHFSSLKNLSDYYPLGYVGHFNESGYKKISDVIKKEITK